MIIKRFAFEFVDFYLYLLYIALYQLNMKNLQISLISLFTIDEIRRVATEVIIPYIALNKEKV
jgi:anoctamin-10